MFYFDILEGLYRKKIKYLIVGGLAANLHGVPRMTQDIDIILLLDRENVDQFLKLMSDLDYIPRLPVDPSGLAVPDIRKKWTNEKNMKAFSFYHRSRNRNVVDIVIDHPLDFNHAYERSLTINVRDFKVSLLNIDDLIEMKKNTGRDRDESDVEMLREIKTLQEN